MAELVGLEPESGFAEIVVAPAIVAELGSIVAVVGD